MTRGIILNLDSNLSLLVRQFTLSDSIKLVFQDIQNMKYRCLLLDETYFYIHINLSCSCLCVYISVEGSFVTRANGIGCQRLYLKRKNTGTKCLMQKKRKNK